MVGASQSKSGETLAFFPWARSFAYGGPQYASLGHAASALVRCCAYYIVLATRIPRVGPILARSHPMRTRMVGGPERGL